MIDKIYSRRRIRIPKIRKKGLYQQKKWRKPKIILVGILLILLISIISFGISAYPILVASCKTAAGSRANHIVNEEVKNVMKDYAYHDLIDIEKDGDGDIVLLKANTMLINEVTSQIVQNIQTAIDHTPTIWVHINYGSVIGLSFLKAWGPKFEIELEAAGRIETELKSEFESVNVNQTIHKIYLDLNTNVNVLTPLGCFGRDLASKVLLTEAVIVGDVPSTYYNLEGLSESDTMNLF